MVIKDKTTIVYSDNIVIRKYCPEDRKAIRTLCCDTAYFGEPCEFFFPDRELLANLTMSYYIDYESEHTWVAEYEGRIVGYIAACFDETIYSRIMSLKIVPISLMQALIKRKIWSKKTCRLIVHNLKSFFLKETNLLEIDHRKFPVHIHQNIKQGFRDRGIGSRLLIALFDEVEKRKLPGIRFRALRQEPQFLFFEKYGFRRIDCKRIKTWEAWLKKKPLYLMEYGKSFND